MKFLIPFLAVLALSATASASTPKPRLVQDKTCSAMKENILSWAAYNASYSHYWYRYGLDSGGVEPRAEAAPSVQSRTGSSKDSAPNNVTGTNNQVQGVDEGDHIKTDGKYIYTVHGNEVVIAQSWPVKDAKIISRIKLNGQYNYGQQLFLNKDKLVVLSNFSEQIKKNQWYSGTRIGIYDITDRSEPELLRHIDSQSYLTQSRMIGDDIYLVGTAGVQIPTHVQEYANKIGEKIGRGDYGTKHHQNAQQKILKRLRKKFASMSADELMPKIRKTAYRSEKFGTFQKAMSCDDVFANRGGTQLGMTTLTHINLNRTYDVDIKAVMGSGWNIFASETALYVASPDYGWDYFFWGARPNRTHKMVTHIHKFKLQGTNKNHPSYVASGSVKGYVHNQFSMSEYKGDLRIATTDAGWWGDQANNGNNLYVVRPSGKTLEVIGKIEGLAKGERIFSARMAGDKGYMVTFRQTDPLFTFDLSNPTKPRVVGELKINGFSSYIHMLDADNLLTIGQDADDSGRVTGLHLQIFNIKNPAKPKRTFHRKMAIEGGYSYSPAQWDHKAFTFDRKSGVLAVPMQIYNWNNKASENFSGVVTYHVDPEDGFSEIGRVNHKRMVEEYRERMCDGGVKETSNNQNWMCQPQYYQYDYSMSYPLTRSIIMDDVLYTVSALGLQATSLWNPKKVKKMLTFV